MKYAKIIDGVWRINPRSFSWNGKTYYNPKARHYLMAGFLPIIEAAQPSPMYGENGEPLYIEAYAYGEGEQEGYVIQSYIPIGE